MSEEENAVSALTTGDGYFVLRNLISADTAARIREHIIGKLESGRVNGPGDINVTNLLREGPEFLSMATNPRLLAVAHALLGADAKLAAYNAKILLPESEPGMLHVDYPYWAMDPGMPVTPALMMQVIWMMNPFSAENGGTWVAPGSQTWPSRVDKDKFAEQAIQLEGAAGDAIVSHGLLWHQTAINHTEEPRVAILINFSQLAIRPMVDMGPFTEEFLEDVPPALRNLLPVDYGKSLRSRLQKNYA